MTPRYALRIDVEIPARDLVQAQERALRLFRPRVRANLRQSVAYVGAYRGCWFAVQLLPAPPVGRVDLTSKPRKLRRKGTR